MKKFFKDYMELRKHSFRFCKEHWIDCLVIQIACWAIALAPITIPVLKEKNDEKKNKNN